jgi:hypothetical protein
MADFRALCKELMDAIDSGVPVERIKQSPLAVRVDAALAQPEPQGVSDEEIRLFVEKTRTDWIKAVTQRGLDPDDFDVVLARAALARWGRPAIEPVPVSDPPGPEDCDAEGCCWAIGERGDWMCVYVIGRSWSNPIYTHWLPHWALPVPGVEGA